MDEVLSVNLFATEGTYPDLTLLFDIPPEDGLARIAKNANREVNRLDLEKLSFHHDVRRYFLSLAERFPSRFVVIDASASIEEVAENAYQAIVERIRNGD